MGIHRPKVRAFIPHSCNSWGRAKKKWEKSKFRPHVEKHDLEFQWSGGISEPLAVTDPGTGRMTNIKTHATTRAARRRGTSAVEVAVMMPVFIMLLAGMMEFGHALFVSHMLKAAAKSGARYGAAGGVTTAQVQAKVKQIVGSSINANKCTVLVKDAGVFDTAAVAPSTINYSMLPAVELSTIEQGHLYIVQVTVPYSQVALLTPKWIIGRTVTGQSVLRHE